MNLIGVHREYEESAEGWKQSNTAQIIISKVKPNVVGEKGTALLQFDTFKNAYYENQGERIYRNPIQSSKK